jgi:predicted nuclease of predicted toxin-antitoxin system
MRLLADENFPFPVVEALRSFGYDILTLSDLGKAGQALTDIAVLKLASDDARAVLTLNRKHFVRLHQSSPEHSGIVVCSFDLDFDGQAKRIRAALGAHSLIAGQLLRVNRPG